MKTTPFTFSFLIGLSLLSRASFGDIILTNTINITLANNVESTQLHVFDDPDVTGGAVGDLLTYTVDPAEWFAGGFSGDRLDGGNAGPGGTITSGNFAIVKGKPSGTITLDLDGGSQTVGSIAIYGGWNNRATGNYTLRDDSGTLGAWNITSGGSTSTNHIETDLYWLTFNTPVTTSNLFIDYTRTDGSAELSFSAIQPFAVIPEPASVLLMLTALGALLVFKRRK